MLLSKNKFLAIFFGLFLFSSLAFAQRPIYSDSTSFKDRLYFGGNFGMQFGTVTLIDVSPLAGVMITDKYSAGIGITYQYFDDRRFIGGSSSTYGGRLFNRYNVLPNIFLHAEYESINFENYNLASERFERIWVNGLFLEVVILHPSEVEEAEPTLPFSTMFSMIIDARHMVNLM